MERKKLQKIYRKTDGYCHICHRKLSLKNYGGHGAKGARHIEHSIAKANGGTNHLNNLFAACISCNIKKGTSHTRTARSQYGNTRAPYSKAKKEEIKRDNTAVGTIIGGVIGLAFGPFGMMIGAGIGAAIGNSSSPEK